MRVGEGGGGGGDSKVDRSSQKTHKESHFSVILRRGLREVHRSGRAGVRE